MTMWPVYFPPDRCPKCGARSGCCKPATFRGRDIFIQGTEGQAYHDTTVADLLGRKLKQWMEKEDEESGVPEPKGTHRGYNDNKNPGQITYL